MPEIDLSRYLKGIINLLPGLQNGKYLNFCAYGTFKRIVATLSSTLYRATGQSASILHIQPLFASK